MFALENTIAGLVSIPLAILAFIVKITYLWIIFPLEQNGVISGFGSNQHAIALNTLKSTENNKLKIIIVGPYSGGKTSLMNRIAKVFSFPFVDSDKIYCNIRDNRMFYISKDQLVKELLFFTKSNSSYVMDLNYFFAHPRLLPKCNLLIILNFPRIFNLSMIILRHFERTWLGWWYIIKTNNQYEHRLESFDFLSAFGVWREDCYIRWQWFIQTRYRNEMKQRCEEFCKKTCRIVWINRPYTIDKWLND